MAPARAEFRAVRLVHLSDLHLGFSAFPRSERGANLRERDHASALRRALQEVIRLRPDLLLITGDLFDHPNPPSRSILTLQRGLASLRTHLPELPILMIAGGRDTPLNPSDPGPVALFDGLPGVEAAAAAPRAVRFRSTGVHALLVPHRALQRPPFPELRPDPGARWNLLLLRGSAPVPGELAPREEWGAEGSGLDHGSGAPVVNMEDWDYVAVGGPHVEVMWSERIRSPGALERPSRDPWRGSMEEQGFLLMNLESGVGEFHPVPGRPVADLAPVRVSSGEVDAGSRRLRDLVEGVPGGIDGKLLRVRLMGDILTPSEGVAPGLLAAIEGRSAHLDCLVEGGRTPALGGVTAEEGAGVLVGGAPPAPLEVEKLGLRWSLAGGEGTRPLRSGELVLISCPTPDLQRRLLRELLGAGGDRPVLRLEAPAPRDELERILRYGSPEPQSLLLALMPPQGSARTPPEAEPGSMAGHRLPELEIALRELRGDAVEASGDLDARTLEWVRERQDADSKLMAYRDRARELRGRIREMELRGGDTPCPTCSRPIGEDLPRTLEALRDEWEGILQDGQWWRRRREQLEEKPEVIREMEARALRLHAAVEAAAEEIERERVSRSVEGHFAPGRGSGESLPLAVQEAGSAALPLQPLPTVLRPLLRGAGRWLSRFSEGRIRGVRIEEGEFRLEGRMGEWIPEGGERLLLSFSLRLAAIEEGLSPHGGAPLLLLSELADERLHPYLLPILEWIGRARPPGWMVLALLEPEVAGRMREFATEMVELQPEEGGGLSLRRTSGGEPTLHLSASPRRESRR